MIELTDAASKELDAYFDGKEAMPIRVCLTPGGCSGPRLGLTLDVPGDSDDMFMDKGYSLCINKELMKVLKSIKIDFTDAGFNLESEVTFGGGGGCSACQHDCSSNEQA